MKYVLMMILIVCSLIANNVDEKKCNDVNQSESCLYMGDYYKNLPKNVFSFSSHIKFEEQDLNKSFFYYKKGCDLNNSKACFAIAEFYKDGNIKVAKNIVEAKEYYLKSCDFNNSNGCKESIKLLFSRGTIDKNYNIIKQLIEKTCKLENDTDCNTSRVMLLEYKLKTIQTYRDKYLSLHKQIEQQFADELKHLAINSLKPKNKYMIYVKVDLLTIPIEIYIKSINKNIITTFENDKFSIDEIMTDIRNSVLILNAAGKVNLVQGTMKRVSSKVLPEWAKEYSNYICGLQTQDNKNELSGCIDIQKNDIRFNQGK